MYSVQELLNLTVQGLGKHSSVDVQGWRYLPVKTRRACVEKLRALRDEMTKSDAVDAIELENKLRQISSGPTFTSSFTRPLTPDPNGPMAIEEDLRKEREAHDALVDDGGQPSHPVDLGFSVLDNPGQYEDIVSYWKARAGRCLFLPQLNDWKEFREYQEKVRHYYIPRNRFPEYQQKVLERRRRHGLQGDIKLYQERDRQSRLQNWMEYQDYNCQILEQHEEEIEAGQEELDSALKELKEAGAVELDGAFESNLYGLALEQDRQKRDAQKEMKVAEKQAELAEEGLEIAKSHGSRDAVKRAALINLAQKEVESAWKTLADSKKSYEKVKVRGKVLGIRGRLTVATTKLRWHRILLGWIERQRLVRASEDPTSVQDTKSHGNQIKKARSRALRNHSASEASRPLRCSKAREKRPPALSPIHQSRISKPGVMKSVPPRQKRIFAACQASHGAEKATNQPSNHLPGKTISKQNMPARGPESILLRPMHSSKVSKDRSKASVGAQSTNRRRNKKEGKPGLQQSRSGQTRSPDRARSKRAPPKDVTTRSGRISRPSIRWAPE